MLFLGYFCVFWYPLYIMCVILIPMCLYSAHCLEESCWMPVAFASFSTHMFVNNIDLNWNSNWNWIDGNVVWLLCHVVCFMAAFRPRLLPVRIWSMYSFNMDMDHQGLIVVLRLCVFSHSCDKNWISLNVKLWENLDELVKILPGLWSCEIPCVNLSDRYCRYPS